MSRLTSARRDWVALGEASRMLGVAPATLRRWTDRGVVDTFVTPGGHRRYRRSSLQKLVGVDAGRGPRLMRSALSPGRLARAYRQAARRAGSELPWLVRLDADHRDWFRVHGRQLAASLLAHLEGDDGQGGGGRALADAVAEAAQYGRMASGLGLSLSQTVEGFLQFRRPFLHQLTVVAAQRGVEATATAALVDSAEAAMDRLLLATLSAHTVRRVRPSIRRGDRRVDIE